MPNLFLSDRQRIVLAKALYREGAHRGEPLGELDDLARLLGVSALYARMRRLSPRIGRQRKAKDDAENNFVEVGAIDAPA